MVNHKFFYIATLGNTGTLTRCILCFIHVQINWLFATNTSMDNFCLKFFLVTFTNSFMFDDVCSV